ncbi:hypothetical protein [Priestia megaterium]|uniref:hypothetical protein n=1 Tax=Priestia megaterium TaxID=1404 RepID=UPI001BE6898A|nr:hypothetical protein [Priestia megaterium]MBE2975507.1 hypothetical protein [Priestia megaterium]MBT2277387.1 hypothetical protein [Priestia megaterium]MCY9025574.1 hypothetical protein [Priestia megaterium]
MIKNPTRSDFFMVMVNISLLYVGLLAIDWRERRRLLGKSETLRERKQRGGSPPARGKRSLARKSIAV